MVRCYDGMIDLSIIMYMCDEDDGLKFVLRYGHLATDLFCLFFILFNSHEVNYTVLASY